MYDLILLGQPHSSQTTLLSTAIVLTAGFVKYMVFQEAVG